MSQSQPKIPLICKQHSPTIYKKLTLLVTTADFCLFVTKLSFSTCPLSDANVLCGSRDVWQISQCGCLFVT